MTRKLSFLVAPFLALLAMLALAPAAQTRTFPGQALLHYAPALTAISPAAQATALIARRYEAAGAGVPLRDVRARCHPGPRSEVCNVRICARWVTAIRIDAGPWMPVTGAFWGKGQDDVSAASAVTPAPWFAITDRACMP